MNFTQGGGKGIDEDLLGLETEAERGLEWDVPLLLPPAKAKLTKMTDSL